YSSPAAGRARVHHRESGDGNHLLHHRQKPAAGGADGFFRLSPVDFALGIHVSVSRHATLGPNGRRSFSSHPFPPHCSRPPLKREWHRRYHASALAERALRSHRFGHRNKTLPADAGLKGNGKELF